MDKKIKFSEQPTRVKVIYGAVIAVLCITAVIIGVVSVASKKEEMPPESNNPPITEGTENESANNDAKPDDSDKEPDKKPEKLTFVSPVVGEVTKYHSLDIPVFSNTLNEWRVHTGIDIATDESCEVFAAAKGVVTKVYSDPFFGKTVEVTHDGGIVSVYSNLSNNDIAVKEGDTIASGSLIGRVGDTSLTELADEPHIHFEIKVDGVSVNPLDYISEDSKEASLGISGV